MVKQVSTFAAPRGAKDPTASTEPEGTEPPMPNFDDPKVMRAMSEMERDLSHLDENNPKHMAYMMR